MCHKFAPLEKIISKELLTLKGEESLYCFTCLDSAAVLCNYIQLAIDLLFWCNPNQSNWVTVSHIVIPTSAHKETKHYMCKTNLVKWVWSGLASRSWWLLTSSATLMTCWRSHDVRCLFRKTSQSRFSRNAISPYNRSLLFWKSQWGITVHALTSCVDVT